MTADKNFTWFDEEINLLLHVVIEKSTGRSRLRNGLEQIRRRNQNSAKIASYAAAARILIIISVICKTEVDSRP